MRVLLVILFFIGVCPAFSQDVRADFYQALNSQRTARGLAPLTVDKSLEKQSMKWLKKSQKYPGLVHDRSIKYPIAEVLAQGGDPLTQWLLSSGHRNAILDKKATAIGVAFYNGRACARLRQ